jgi:hypothetical protein
MLELEERLTMAYRRSGLTPQEFYMYICDTRIVLRKSYGDLSFTVCTDVTTGTTASFEFVSDADAWLFA